MAPGIHIQKVMTFNHFSTYWTYFNIWHNMSQQFRRFRQQSSGEPGAAALVLVPGTTLQRRSSAPSVSTRRSCLGSVAGVESVEVMPNHWWVRMAGWVWYQNDELMWRDTPQQSHQILSQDWPGFAMFPALARHCESLSQV